MPNGVRWRLVGGIKQDLYYSERIYEPVQQGTVPSAMPDPREPFYADLGGGVSALIPLALFADDAGTLPHQAVATETTTVAPMPPTNEKTLHLATVVLAWNVFQHFYPYFDVVKTDWLATLRDALAATVSAKNEEQFLNVLRDMVAQLHDGHGQVQYSFIVENEVPDTDLLALQQMHARIFNLGSEWAKHLEGSYFPKTILKSGDPAKTDLLYLDNTHDKLILSDHDNTLVVRWVVREYGITLAGIAPKELIEPVSSDSLRREILSTMQEWSDEIFSSQWKINGRNPMWF